ncbi:hypothetical protein PTKIN_Ptkin12aG0159700 [Pterospermum kingtungense]
MEYRCVHCGFRVKTLLVQYSLGNIRLMKCENCKAVADEYIECELMIVLIDLILHKPKVYKHILYNALNLQITHFQILVDVILGNFMFLCSFLLAMRNLLKTSARCTRSRDLLLAVLISSYFKIFLAAMMVCFLYAS